MNPEMRCLYSLKVVSQCFALTGREDAPAVQGIPGFLDVYKQALQRVSLVGRFFSTLLFASQSRLRLQPL